jgi:hypothetical protein
MCLNCGGYWDMRYDLGSTKIVVQLWTCLFDLSQDDKYITERLDLLI